MIRNCCSGLNLEKLGEMGLIARDLNYLDAQAKASDRLPPDRYRPLLEEIQLEAERVRSDAEGVHRAANARTQIQSQ